ncbi:cellulose biosynthesis cyclic di-GMP-binding regulatory protein BcsB [Legionella sp. CNM-4043-24]|uniref:cellulose biosynthesis cyclic di-GMP-binding regulatory protein BcsB n=1 Tax=Legionella sp. CNM-4043-24 TaxID=3421646 RepID=UPI00403AFED1
MSANVSSETFTLNQLSKMDTAVLEGRKPSYTFYIPIPGQWQMESIDLNLLIQFSPLLLDTSSLTLMVGDTPLDSIRLDAKKEQPLFWKVTIPRASISKKITTVRLVGYMVLSDEVCRDLENQGNWVTLSGNSSITYHFQNRQSGLSLSEFPNPFIHKDAPFADRVLFYLPAKTGADEFAPYFQLANILSREASWRGIEIDAKNMSEFDALSPAFPSVIIGTPDAIDFSSLGAPEGLQLQDGKWLQKDGKALNAENGFVWLSQRGQQPVLVISSNSKEGIATAIQSINSNMMHFTSINPALFIAEPVSDPDKKPLKKARSIMRFRDLGYKDNIVFGSGQNQISYQFNLPLQYTNKPVRLVLNYSHSPFLQMDRESTMSVSLNGLPLDGATLKADSAQLNMFELNLPQKQLQLGKNNLTITFNMVLPEKFCSRDYLSQAWATVYDNSYLQFYKSDDFMRDQIKSYPDLMSGKLMVVLPSDPAAWENKSLIKELIRFAGMLDQSTSLTVSGSASKPADAENHNLVYFGMGNDNSPVLDSLEKTFTQLVENLNATSNSTLKGIDKSIFMNAFTKNQDIGFVGIRSTGTDSQYSQLILFGYTSNELRLATSLLNNTYKLSFLTGNLAVSFQNGTFTNLSSDDIQENVQTEVAMERVSEMTVNYLLYGLGVLMLSVLVYFGWRTWRKK